MDHDLAWLRDEITSSSDEQTWEILRDRYGLENLGRISQYGLLLLTPDFAPQKLIRPLFDWFERWDSEPVAAAAHCFNVAEITLLYAGRVTHRSRKGRMHSGWLSPRLYGLGTSLLLVLKSRVGAPPFQYRISKVKGISRYGEHTEAHVRGMSKISDRCLSLIHTPDNYEGFFHLAELVVGSEGTAAALHPEREPIAEEQLATLINKPDLKDEIHPFDLIFRLIEQAAILLRVDPRVKIPPRILNTVFREVAAARDRLARLSESQQLEDETWNALSKLQPALADLTSRQLQPVAEIESWPKLKFSNAMLELCRVLQEMCERKTFNTLLSHDLVEIFRRVQLPLDAWEEQRLHVLAAFHGQDSASDAAAPLPPDIAGNTKI
jgi:hypothetical protein